MEKQKTLSALVESASGAMERLNYHPLTIQNFRLDCRRFATFVHSTTGEDIFTEELGAKYLKEVFNFPSDEWVGTLPSRISDPVRCIRKLGEYSAYGAFVNPRKPRLKTAQDWTERDRTVLTAYLNAVQTADNSEATKQLRTHHIELFYEFLGLRGINGVAEMSAQIISDYALSLQGGSLVYAKHRLSTLRYYFRFLHKNGYCEKDWSHCVPKVIAPQNLNVPTLWTSDEVEQVLKSIDRGSPAGKRDYAIVLLVSQLGLRIADVANLKLDNLKWERKDIVLSQHKNRKETAYPLLGDTGWAIIDYIRYARPETSEPFVFITCNAPYTKLQRASVGDILARRMRRCGIKNKKPGTVSGMHSLRHALARRLLEQGTSLSDVASIMGHTNYSSTFPYLKVDIDGLRECALSLEGVDENA
ncbi:MAG: tyrosine-type recombinase/integrase [Defluviitaleaceae bacterium]|nr:tyrosine-type recombinase/integrase [Defluviitaleaceae bacterium]